MTMMAFVRNTHVQLFRVMGDRLAVFVLILVPSQVAPAQRLEVSAFWARNVITALTAIVPGLLDPADVLDRRRRPQDDLPVPKRFGALDAKRDLITLVASPNQIPIHLVEHDNPRRNAPEASGAVCPHEGFAHLDLT